MRTVTRKECYEIAFDYLLKTHPERALEIKALRIVTLFNNKDKLKDEV